MRSINIDGFIFDGRQWRELTERAGLDDASQLGLLNLLIWAWTSPGCALPADDMARLSRMGEAWGPSKLKDRLGMWFEELPSGHWQARDLAEQQARRLYRSDQTRKAAQARWHSGRSAGGNPDAHANASKRTAAGDRTARNPDAQTCLRPKTRTEEGRPCPPPTPPPTAHAHYTPPAATPTFSQPCANEPPPAMQTHSERPPHGCVFSSSLEEERNTHTPNGGGGGANADARLFPAMLLDEMPARQIVDAYMDKVQPGYPASMNVVRAVSWWLTHGQSEELMLRAVENYADAMNKLDKPARYRKSAATFFSRQDPAFTDFQQVRARPASTARRPAAQPAPRMTAEEYQRYRGRVMELAGKAALG